MNKKNLRTSKFATNSVRAGTFRSSQGEHSESLYLTSSFIFQNAEEAAERFANQEAGNVYSRFTNPSVKMFEDRLAILEEAEECVATSTGMSAILSCIMSLCRAGDHVVVSRSVFGTTVKLFDNILSEWGLEVSYVALSDEEQWKNSLKKNTKLFFVETPSNPLMEVCDIKFLADLAHKNKSLLIVDNCFCTPAHQIPVRFGADIIIHSATKYLDGQGRCLGGAVLGKRSLMKKVRGFLRSAGTSMSPFNAWVFLKGLETLKIRMDAHASNAYKLAVWLEQNKKIEKVYYPGLDSHPQYELVKKQQNTGGGVVSFKVKGGKEAAWKLINSTRLLSITANLGDTRSTITHPSTTTHSRLNQDQRDLAGITENLIRIAVGLEDIDDIKADIN
ncbi:MAG: O-succinylhomoserine sulfhydrylase [Nitrosomonadales bacterium]|jgi:O-succinylhomoserine sulfhydrylase|nr:O-succinylhomoserine sulfhydrylase [Nitrosomonadales bacterium]MBT4183242.1 O-succinylhomoserine sulfhydrylase [Nitrosomonadales bacterium]MBT6015485.1 O-succinylhomoserine sulfhydrylase [Nitrosomonadales bacterium]MBT6602761.1 O-succinylhomoserine sulfhydrylase [Nitrosomonadales bacterium]MBT6818628.1 O-succinylhomoserine sulfhydrylase [Nitrosomonadales bacterium]